MMAVPLAFVAASAVQAQDYTLTALADFSGANGASPYAALTRDSLGNLYGSTGGGGANSAGTIFRISNTGTAAEPVYGGLTTLASFNGSNGSAPFSSLTLDSAGSLYGTTSSGGASGAGTVFKISNTGTLANPVYGGITTLATFNGGSNGSNPFAGVTLDNAGNLYGTTVNGGTNNLGTVFKISNSGTAANPVYSGSITTLINFNGTISGSNPYGGVTIDSQGNLFGTTYLGGTNNAGTVFEIINFGTAANPSYSSINVLASFVGSNGYRAYSGITLDSAGNLYGTTVNGGTNNAGTVFTLENQGTATNANYTGGIKTLAFFDSTANGINPSSALTLDEMGNLFGTTYQGGANGLGTIFTLANSGTVADPTYSGGVKTLASFTDVSGGNPWAGVTLDGAGNLIGTASTGGTGGQGTVFVVSEILPEPGSLALLSLCGLPLAACRWSRRQQHRKH
jgi:uncharacterized repeat protein (TIGR03803 family)